ncbi:YxeA family protein [Aureibacillus halotolerans]|uniref:Uncharacterized protein (TIGR01655 family) n=1 Tax=Aureibacillus halotolerans TaxID=1508390 RepID=A0A4R6U3V6_9BACI|nr:YxeA family protein [Aureibacillus halotolerans]TDQ40366.1 uncharacterized protein (TIGR01655 family) [Aureibacillus halotolerans]
MRKVVGVIITVVILFIGGIVVLATVDFNRMGKEHLYIQTSEPANVEETTLDSGQIVKSYWYEALAFNEEGEELVVEYSATKKLALDAYLKLYVKNENEVTSYDEVQWEDIPVKAQEQLKE